MSSQIATRFPDTLAVRIDEAVATGWAPNRSALIVRAVEREIRRAAASRDASILATDPHDDDIDPLVAWSTSLLKGSDLDA